MNKDEKIYIAGHEGLVGSAILRYLSNNDYNNLIYRSFNELDLRKQNDVYNFFDKEQPEYVFLAAAKVGGIHANRTFPADFIRDNLLIQTNIIDAAYCSGVKKLLFLGSSCIYPKFASQPLKEEYLLTGELEETNDAYAIAKIAGIKMCQSYNKQYETNFISVMPTNLYGPNDNFDLETSHVLPALIRKFHEAKENGLPQVEIWGTGSPRREFLHVDDLAAACCFLMDNYYDSEIVNIGTGQDITISELAYLIKDIVDYRGELVFNPTMPDGTPRKLLDTSKINNLGWQANISLAAGIKQTYDWFIINYTK